MDLGVVVAFAESAALRETIAILLEHDCQLRFLRDDAAASDDCGAAGAALVAVQHPDPLLHDLHRHWPVLPIVAVDLPEASRSHPRARSFDSHVSRVPLEPHAIRSTVLQQLAPEERAPALRATARLIGETLRADLSYSFAALRSFSRLHASSAGPDTYALLGAVMREQSYVLGQTVDQLERFRNRPRTTDVSPAFPAALCHQLERADLANGERSLLCERSVDAACSSAGPLALVPAVAGFLRAHLRRRADTPVVTVQLTSEGVSVRYRRRRGTGTTRSWPLLLAGLALDPWLWSVRASVEDDHEVVRLRRAT